MLCVKGAPHAVLDRCTTVASAEGIVPLDSGTRREIDAANDAMARDGRGPLMDVEDMDLFFCAQEYEYAASFADAMKLKSVRISGMRASAVVESPYGWQTPFRFVRDGGSWRISGYCVFR